MPKTKPIAARRDLVSHVAGPVETIMRGGAARTVQRCLRCDRVIVALRRPADAVELGDVVGPVGSCPGRIPE